MSYFKGNHIVTATKLKNHERRKLIIHASLLNFNAKQSTPYEVISPLAAKKVVSPNFIHFKGRWIVASLAGILWTLSFVL